MYKGHIDFCTAEEARAKTEAAKRAKTQASWLTAKEIMERINSAAEDGKSRIYVFPEQLSTNVRFMLLSHHYEAESVRLLPIPVPFWTETGPWIKAPIGIHMERISWEKSRKQ